MKDFRELKVWEKSHWLVLEVYAHSAQFPKSELFGLTSQLRRSAASIPANIAEGCGRETDADFCRFVQIAMGSACETEYHLLLAHDLQFLSPPKYEVLAVQTIEVKRMLSALIKKLKADR